MQYTRQNLIQLCDDAVVVQSEWSNRDSADAQKQVGQIRQLLKAGCGFVVLEKADQAGVETDEDTIWLEITYKGFWDFENGEDASQKDIVYLPTPARIKKANGKDWY
jgi:hypothetical protein